MSVDWRAINRREWENQQRGIRWKVGGWVARLGLKLTRLGTTIRHGRGPWEADDEALDG